MLNRSFTRAFSSSLARDTRYGFVGIGQMGQHMARHIYEQLAPEDSLYLYDTLPNVVDAFITSNTTADPSRAEQVKKVTELDDLVTKVDGQLDYIVTMVPEGRHVKLVVQTLVESYKKTGTKQRTIIADSSTIDIPTSREVHDYVKKELPNFDFIDTPVSGGVAGARKGTLSFMLSRAELKDIDEGLTTLIQKMGKNIFPCGSNHGSGLAAKLSNNYLLAITNMAVADSFQLAKSLGLDLQAYARLVAVSTGKSWASVDNCPIAGVYPAELQMPADVGFKGGFITKLTRKDLTLAMTCADQAGRLLFLGDLGKYWYDKACEDEDIANRDLGVLYEWLEHLDTRSK